MTALKSNDNFEGRPHLFELIGPNGEYGGLFNKASDAAAVARRTWPDQEQDPERTGKGWDVQLVGTGNG